MITTIPRIAIAIYVAKKKRCCLGVPTLIPSCLKLRILAASRPAVSKYIAPPKNETIGQAGLFKTMSMPETGNHTSVIISQ